MMTFAEAPSVLRGLTDLLFFLQFILLVTVFFVNLDQRRVFPLFVRNMIIVMMSAVVYLFYQLGVGFETETHPAFEEYVRWYTSLPFAIIMGISIAFSAELAIYIYYCFFWAGNHITSSSVKEAVDNLPGGVCIYEESGRIVIKNSVISEVARHMTGRNLLDGNAFKDTIISYGSTVKIGDKYVVTLTNGSVWSFSFDTLESNKERYSFINCGDITEEYAKTLELEEAQREVMNLNLCLTSYNQEIVSTISAREVLDAKVKIHDELGTGLLAIKHYLTMGGTDEEKAAIMDRIKRNITYLKSETEQRVSDEYELMITTAQTLGVKIDIDGVLPEEEPCKHVLATAIHECFTNTLRHAQGNNLKISLLQTDSTLTAVFTNNGTPPTEEIVEKGGLKSLHALVSNSGGEMNIVSKPDFKLQITLPFKEE